MKRFQGFLVKIGDYEVPLQIMEEGSYDGKVNTLDDGSETDNTGYLDRYVLQRIPIVQFTTMEMNEEQLNDFMDACRAQYEIEEQRKARCTVWVPEYGRYVEQDMFMADPSIKIKGIDLIDNTITYLPFTVKLESYGED